ncbi:hypothetical protein CFC21_051818 [Triticum aestivum]|uniref:Uncharacterized protein n=4 Tax=Triticum TaxID=4564 RepID=A0A9R0VW77_TRITD|nr:uncharacterized protein LOC123081843 [Triticum aestivum]KAF7042139.1 hypothetical protein CFC21_051818 [Triticum aestivum]VAH89496.1 unnamed protein product [Triticum turgidum subsp. durum]
MDPAQGAGGRRGVLIHGACINRFLPRRLCTPYHHTTPYTHGSSDYDYDRGRGRRYNMALGDDSPASYIRMVHHLIEKCMTFGMSMEECMEALSKRADVQPVVTSTVWKELEKENKEFFDRYNKQLRSEKGGRSSCSSSSDSSS